MSASNVVIGSVSVYTTVASYDIDIDDCIRNFMSDAAIASNGVHTISVS